MFFTHHNSTFLSRQKDNCTTVYLFYPDNQSLSVRLKVMSKPLRQLFSAECFAITASIISGYSTKVKWQICQQNFSQLSLAKIKKVYFSRLWKIAAVIYLVTSWRKLQKFKICLQKRMKNSIWIHMETDAVFLYTSFEIISF